MTNRNVIRMLTAVVLASGAVAAAAYLVLRSKSDAEPETAEPAPVQRPKPIADATSGGGDSAEGDMEVKKARRERRKRNLLERAVVRQIPLEERDDLTESEKDIVRKIESAVDAEDIEAMRAILPEVAASTNSEVRSEAVDGLGWIGSKALLDLLPFMADPDPAIAQDARDNWVNALADVSEKRRVRLVEDTMKIITDREALEDIVNEFDDCDEIAAIQALVNIIATGTPTQAEVAKEEYEFITGEEYTTFEDAEQWLKDNYDFDEPDEDEPAPDQAS